MNKVRSHLKSIKALFLISHKLRLYAFSTATIRVICLYHDFHSIYITLIVENLDKLGLYQYNFLKKHLTK